VPIVSELFYVPIVSELFYVPIVSSVSIDGILETLHDC